MHSRLGAQTPSGGSVSRTSLPRSCAPARERVGRPQRGPLRHSVFVRMGALGLLGLRYPEQYGGRAATTSAPRSSSRRRWRAVSPAGWAWPSAPPTPRWRHRRSSVGTEAQKKRYLGPCHPRREDRRARHHRGPTPAVTSPGTLGFAPSVWTRALADERQQAAASPTGCDATSSCWSRVPVPGSRSGHGITLLPRRRNLPGFTVSRKLKKLGMRSSDTAELSFNDVEVGDDAVLGEVGQDFCSTSCGSCRASALMGSGRSHRGRRGRLRGDAHVVQGARGVRTADREVPGQPAQARRPLHRRSPSPGISYTALRSAGTAMRTRSRRSRWRSCWSDGHDSGRRHLSAAARRHGLMAGPGSPILPQLAADSVPAAAPTR